MPKLPVRVKRMRDAIRKRGGMKKVTIALLATGAVTLALFIAEIIAEGIITQHAWPWLRDRFWILAHQPIGSVALAVVVFFSGWIALLLLLGLWDSRTKTTRSAERESLPPLSDNEKLALAAFRGCLLTHASEPQNRIQYIGNHLAETLKSKSFPWVDYLKRTVAHHENAWRFVTEDLEVPNRPLLSVRETFVGWANAYMRLIREIAMIDEQYPDLLEAKLVYVNLFRDGYHIFAEKLQELCNGWPELSPMRLNFTRGYFQNISDRTAEDFVFGKPVTLALLGHGSEAPLPKGDAS